MTTLPGTEHGDGTPLPARPPRAVVGSQISHDEEMFGAAFDGRVLRRFFNYVRPYREQIQVALCAVIVVQLSSVFRTRGVSRPKGSTCYGYKTTDRKQITALIKWVKSEFSIGLNAMPCLWEGAEENIRCRGSLSCTISL